MEKLYFVYKFISNDESVKVDEVSSIEEYKQKYGDSLEFYYCPMFLES